MQYFSTQFGLQGEPRVSLDQAGFDCLNYYWGEGGQRIGITHKELRAIGLEDDTMWVHPWVISPLIVARKKVAEAGYGIRIVDAFRPVSLYRLIAQKRKAKGQPLHRFNLTDTPHATYMAIDVVLIDENGNQPWMRDDADGVRCHEVDFYRQGDDDKAREYQRLQDILVSSFLSTGFFLGFKREYWHFQLYQAKNATRY